MQTELIEKIIHLPVAERIEIIERISRSLREDLQAGDAENISLAERKMAYLRLRGALKMDNPPMTREDERKIIDEYLSEKHS